jgi:hypothetical protein
MRGSRCVYFSARGISYGVEYNYIVQLAHEASKNHKGSILSRWVSIMEAPMVGNSRQLQRY